MFKNGKFFGKFNIVDATIAIVVFVLLLGVFAVKTKVFKPLSKVITKGEKTVEFAVTTRAYDVTSATELFNVGDKTFITIRNVPYTKLQIVDYKYSLLKQV